MFWIKCVKTVKETKGLALAKLRKGLLEEEYQQ
jgi:hypothetical protein